MVSRPSSNNPDDFGLISYNLGGKSLGKPKKARWCQVCGEEYWKAGNAKYCDSCKIDVEQARDRARSSRGRADQLGRAYSLTTEEYDSLMAAHNYQCDLCGSTKRVCVDHDHKSGRVRGVLCTKHNTALSQFGDNASGLWDAFRYIVGIPTRPDWHSYYMMMCDAVAARSDCKRALVGAVIVRPDHSVAGSGYVGVKPGEPGCLSGACPRGNLSTKVCPRDSDYSNCISTHAEENAVRNSTGSLAGCTIYVTRKPCGGCEELLRVEGVARAFWPGGYLDLTPPKF
jgi:dCMP deaminase